MKLVVEPGGDGRIRGASSPGRVTRSAPGKRIGVVLSGGNVDPEIFGRLVAGLGPDAA